MGKIKEYKTSSTEPWNSGKTVRLRGEGVKVKGTGNSYSEARKSAHSKLGKKK